MSTEPQNPPDEAAETAAPAAPAEAAEAIAAAAPAPGLEPAARPPVDIEACASELKARFPALFGGPIKPIKLRIQTDIQQRAPGVFTRQALSAFLRRYTGGSAYLVALGQATQRFDLDGQPAGEISAEHHEAAAQELARRRALRREREQAMRQAQQARQAPPADERPRQPGQRPPRPRANPSSERQTAGGRPDRPPPSQRHPGPRPARTDGQRPPRPQPPAAAAPRPAPPPAGPEDSARRERAQLLRAFDSSPLTKANFCALKGMTVEALDAALAQARQEAAAWAAAHPPSHPSHPPHQPRRPR